MSPQRLTQFESGRIDIIIVAPIARRAERILLTDVALVRQTISFSENIRLTDFLPQLANTISRVELARVNPAVPSNEHVPFTAV